MWEPPPQAVYEDGGAALGHREAVAPEPQRVAEPECGREHRVRALARQPRRRLGHADADDVDRLGSDTPRTSVARRSASAWATDGGPA